MATSIVLAQCLFCNDKVREFRPFTAQSRPRRDLTGSRFGRLTVQHALGVKNHLLYWCCLCDCNTPHLAHSKALTYGHTKSCGCLQRENAPARTHGHSGTTLYYRWKAMMRRCTKPYDISFAHYGARGITVCERWLNFANFYADMGEPPPGLSLERRDNNGPYSPENCYWATPEEQQNNTRQNRYFTHDNVTLTLAQWARRLNLPLGNLQVRLALGWDIERILTTPIDTSRAHKRSPLPVAAIQTIRQRGKAGDRGSDLAREFGVSVSCISRILLGKTFKWLKPVCDAAP